MKSSVGLLLMLLAVQTHAKNAVIDNGYLAVRNQFPSVVSLGMGERAGTVRYVGRCSGTLVAPDVVLTAAHCLFEGENKFIKVSLSGDETGEVVQNGIQVTHQYMPRAYGSAMVKVFALEKKLQKVADGEEMPKEEFEALLNEYSDAVALSSANDIAFMVLERPQEISENNISKVGCSSLPRKTSVTIAGYGANMLVIDTNQPGRLYYGHNKISGVYNSSSLYELNLGIGTQLANSGDSGGPLFRSGNKSFVYGVVSVGSLHEEHNFATSNIYTALGSSAARTFYRELRLSSGVPLSLKNAINHCR